MNAAYFEHAYLAEKTGAALVSTDDVIEKMIIYILKITLVL